MTRLLYSDKTAAEALSMSRAKVRELMATGDLPSFKIGGMRRITHESLVAYAETAARASRPPRARARAASAVTR